MGSWWSAAVEYFWVVVSAFDYRDEFISTLPAGLAPFVSPAAAFASMPKLLETRPWRSCTDANNNVWAITNTTSTTALATRETQTTHLASEAYTAPEWIMCALPSMDGFQEGLNVVYHVPYLEAWADAAMGIGNGWDLERRGQELATLVTGVAQGVANKNETPRVVYNDGATVGMMKTGVEDIDLVNGHYRRELDVKPGVFDLLMSPNAASGAELELRCPQHITN